MAKRKASSTIQAIVDQYATGIVRRADLMAKTCKNETGIKETGAALVDHVKATGGNVVAFQAANGRTLLVEHTTPWNNPIRVIEPGALKAPPAKEPPSAAIAGDVAALLAKGAAGEARKLIDQTLMAGAGTPAEIANKTATEVTLQDRNMILNRAHDIYGDMRDAMVYGLSARLVTPRYFFRKGFDPVERQPEIEQKTFNSAALGRINLSARAKGLLEVNRRAISNAIERSDYNASGKQVSASRGEIAQYISELEQRVNALAKQVNAGA